jgi:6-pyruvoyltetrahydropterin/6-carboxytetrahydropterin synthase
MYEAERYHDFSAGHRVYGHENKCAHLHGHNYRVHFTCSTECLDTVGRVIDFGIIKSLLCEWLEVHWDHKMLIWKQDPMLQELVNLDPAGVVPVPFNPTAENMAKHLVMVVGPSVLTGTGVFLVRCRIDETRKCSATYYSTEK